LKGKECVEFVQGRNGRRVAMAGEGILVSQGPVVFDAVMKGEVVKVQVETTSTPNCADETEEPCQRPRKPVDETDGRRELPG